MPSLFSKGKVNDSDEAYSIGSSSSSMESENNVQDNYLFTSYIAFVLWSSYVKSHNRLNLVLTDDKSL